MATNLNETAIAAAARRAAAGSKRVELADKGHPGLRLRIAPTGRKAWALACRDGEGRMRSFWLGTHPQMGLGEARRAADTMRVAVRGGADPVAEGRRKRAIGRDARENIGTLAALVELYGKKRGQTLKSWPDAKRRIDSVFAKQLQRPVATMRRADLQFEADNWRSPQSAAAAVRYIRPILRWAAAGGREYVARDLSDLTPPATVGRRERVLSREELARLLPVLAMSERPYARAMSLMLLTACRREEAGAECWRDVDFEARTWSVPETKNRKKHVVTLSRQAAALFSGIKPQVAKPDDLIFATAGGLRLGNWDKGTKTVQTASQTDGWTRHDLRRTAATLMGELGEPPHVIEAALNHAAVHSQLAATYNQARYRSEVAAALQRLADHLDAIAAGGATVVRLRA